MTDIEPLHALAYVSDPDPINLAVKIVAVLLEVNDNVRDTRRENPGAYPLVPADAGPDHWAARVVAWLMDAGWQPPSPDVIKEAADGARSFIEGRDDVS